MTQAHRITIDPQKCGGRPCLRGLRIRVKDALDLLAAGASREEILADFPALEPEDITAALEYRPGKVHRGFRTKPMRHKDLQHWTESKIRSDAVEYAARESDHVVLHVA